MIRQSYALAALGCLLIAQAAQAQTFPAKPVTIVVTAAAGGVSDVVARAIGQRLSETWGQQVVIENRGGAAHTIGAAVVARATPDGHMLMVSEAGTFVINPALYGKDKLPFDIQKDFAPITGLVRINHALIAHPSLPAGGPGDLIKLAKERSAPLTYGTAGIGSAPHMNMALLGNAAAVKFQPVHYRGATPALTDVVAGHINMMLISVSSALPPMRAGHVKMLAVGSAARLPELPDVAVIAEAGLPGFRAGTWFGLATTGGTPRDIVMKINADVRRILTDPAFREQFLGPQLYEAMGGSPEEFAELLKSETEIWSKLIAAENLKVD